MKLNDYDETLVNPALLATARVFGRRAVGCPTPSWFLEITTNSIRLVLDYASEGLARGDYSRLEEEMVKDA